MESQFPKISIVVPSFNQGAFLRDALESIFSQEYPDLEVVVMDGGSTDNTVEIIQTYKNRIKYWQSQPDGGQADAINAGMQYCTGEIVSWLNSDDWYINDPFWTVARAYQENPECGLFVGNGFRHRNGEYKPFCPRHIAIAREVLREGLDYILQPATFMSRDAWHQSGGLNSDLNYGLDWDLFIRILEKHPAAAINEFLAVSREHEETKSSLGQFRRAGELRKIPLQNTQDEAILNTARYLMNDAIYEFLAITSENQENRTFLRKELLEILSLDNHINVTLGSAYYLLDTILSASVRDDENSARAHKAIYLGIQRIQQKMKERWGAPDSFPILPDGQDKVFIPFAGTFDSKPGLNNGTQPFPKISIIIPSYNQAEFLSRTLDSVIRQKYPALEIMVFDGGSTDGSVDIIKEYASHLAFWQSETDQGAAHAINKGFAKATGDIIGWLNSDDMLTADALWHIAAEFMRTPDTEVVFGNALYIDEQDRVFLADHGTHRTGLYFGKLEPLSNVPYYWTYVYAIPQPTVYFRRQVLEKTDGLDQAYHFIFDFEFFWRLRQASTFKKIEKTLALYRIHANSKTSNWNKFMEELFRFSLPLWPERNSPEYNTILSSLIDHYFPLQSDFVKKIIRPLITYQIISPEKLAMPAGLKQAISYIIHFPRRVYNKRHGVKNRLVRLFQLNSRQEAENHHKSSHIYLPDIAQRENPVYPVLDEGKKHTIIFCGLQFPRHPGHSGGEIRDFHMLRKFLGQASVDFFALWSIPAQGRREDLRPYFQMIYEPDILNSDLVHRTDKSALRFTIKSRLLLWLRNRNIPVYGPKYHHDAYRFTFPNRAYVIPGLCQVLKAVQPDFLIIAPQLNPLPLQIPFVPGETRVILSSYDVEAIRLERMAASQIGLAKKAMHLEAYRAGIFEHDTLKHYDGIIAVSDTDKQSYIQRYQYEPDRILVLDNSVDTDYFSFRHRVRTDHSHVVFIGNLGYWPNEEAAQRLLEDIMPLVRRHIPNARAWIVGQWPSQKISALSDRHLNFVTGKVDDVRPYLDSATVACIPLRTGSGTKYKVLEAASAGAPIVCTPLALEGLSLKADEHVLIGQSNQELADGIIRIIQNPAESEKRVQEATMHIQKHYAWNSNLQKLQPWLETIQKLPKHAA